MQTRLLNEFEMEYKLIPSFVNTNNSIKSIKTELYIGSNSMEVSNGMYCDIVKSYVEGTYEDSTTVTSVISTYSKLNLEVDEEPTIKSGDYKLINYSNSITCNEQFKIDKQLMYLESTINSLTVLKEEGTNAVNLFTDSNYLLFILKSNIFKDAIAMTYHIKHKLLIRKLYELCYEFDYIFLSYYSGNLIPNKLRYAMNKSKEINEYTLKTNT